MNLKSKYKGGGLYYYPIFDTAKIKYYNDPKYTQLSTFYFR